MKTDFGFIDPGAIMGVVVALIILGVGVFAFFVTIGALPSGEVGTQTLFGADYYTENGTFAYFNSSDWTNAQWIHIKAYNQSIATGNVGSQVFNIIGIVMVIGAIMSIVGLVYNYVR